MMVLLYACILFFCVCVCVCVCVCESILCFRFQVILFFKYINPFLYLLALDW